MPNSASTKAAGAKIAGGKKISNDIQVSEKYVVNFRFEVRNKGGHSSLPVPDNAIYHLAAALDRLAAIRLPAEDQRSHRRLLQANGDDRKRAR